MTTLDNVKNVYVKFWNAGLKETVIILRFVSKILLTYKKIYTAATSAAYIYIYIYGAAYMAIMKIFCIVSNVLGFSIVSTIQALNCTKHA